MLPNIISHNVTRFGSFERYMKGTKDKLVEFCL